MTLNVAYCWLKWPNRGMKLWNVEISGLFDDGSGRPLSERIDNEVNGADPDEVDLQRRAIAKHVYEKLITDLSDTSDEDLDNEFWDGTNKVYDFFKYELHETMTIHGCGETTFSRDCF